MNDDVDLKIEKIKFYEAALFKMFELHSKASHSNRIDWCQEQIIYLIKKVDDINHEHNPQTKD